MSAKQQTALATKETEAIDQLERLAADYGPMALATLSDIHRSFKLAEGVALFRKAVRHVTSSLRHLAGTPLGFKTDEDRRGGGGTGYDDDTLAEALTEAILRGVSWVGNEFNIIKGRCYVTKEGYSRLVREIPGLTDLILIPGVPKGHDGGAVVPFKATWKLDGKPMSLERQIPVKLNAGMGADGAIGKATRKMLASVHFACTGSNQSGADVDADPADPADAPVIPSRAADLRERLTAPAAAPPPATGGTLPMGTEPPDLSALHN